MTEDESEVFEITDFTTASEWERFIAKLEEVFHEWRLSANLPFSKLKKGELTTGSWEEKTESIDFAGFKFNISRHTLSANVTHNQDALGVEGAQAHKESKHDESESEETPMVWQDMMSINNDFPGRAHCLCRYYGLRDFVTMAPAPDMDDIMTESRANILASSVAIAINNTASKVPIFIQVHSKWRKMYNGHFEMPGFRTSFEMVHLKHAPKQYRHLSGLLDVFNSKIASAAPERPAVSVAVRFTYVLKEWSMYDWSQPPPDMDSITGEEVGVGDFGVLPFGACTDPVEDLQLSVTWPSLSEEMIVDGDVYSDLNPLQAPHWVAKVRMADELQCLLGDYLDEFVELCRNNKSTQQLLGKAVEEKHTEELDVTSALDRLADPAYNIPTLGHVVKGTTTVVTRATAKLQIKPEEAPVPTHLLNEILMFLFPDAKEDFLKNSADAKMISEHLAKATKLSDTSLGESTKHQSKTDLTDQQDSFRQLKAAPVDSVSHRLAIVMAVLNHSYGGVRAVAHLWQEFVLEMRYRWEHNIMIQDLEHGSPNMGCSLLHQKLQMLNCCIERKKARETTSNEDTTDSDLLSNPVKKNEDQNVPQSTDFVDTNKVKVSSVLDVNNKEITDQTSQKVIKNEVTLKEPSDIIEKEEIIKDESKAWEVDSASLSSDDEFFECEDDEDAMESSTSSAGAIEKGNSSVKVTRSSSRASRTKIDKNAPRMDLSKKDKVDEFGAKPSQSEPSISASSQSNSDPVFEKNESENRSRKSSSQSEAKESSSHESEMDGSFAEVYGHQPEGRLKPCGDLKLLNNNEILYIPVTQEPAPMTEDMLDEHAEVLAKLGTSEEGMHLRARMQSASLLSDMESFKAANPGCTLGDFVRWYSPRDWVINEETDENGEIIMKGELSQRMQIPGNMWVEVWQSARPVPARRQRRLFDDTKEAEKVLHWLASLSPSGVAMRLMPMLVHAAVRRLQEVKESEIPSVKKQLHNITDRAIKLMRAPNIELKKFEDLVRQLSHTEVSMTRAQSLQQKLSHERHEVAISDHQIQSFVSTLLEQPEVNVTGAASSPIGRIIHNLFKASQKAALMVGEEDMMDQPDASTATGSDSRRTSIVHIPDFPPPAGKEYILRTLAQRPAPWSRPSPQRLYSIWMHNDFRLLGAFSSDTTFQ